MTRLKKPAGAYLIGIAGIVAAFFITNPLLAGLLDPAKAWAVLDILMLIGLLTALAFNLAAKRTLAEGQEPDDSVSRRNLEINSAFYLTAGLTILFLHNWFSLLAQGPERLAGNHQAWVIWAAVDTMQPLVMGTTGCRIMREKSSSSRTERFRCSGRATAGTACCWMTISNDRYPWSRGRVRLLEMGYPPEAGFRLGQTPADDSMPGNPDANQCQRIRSDADRFKCAEATELDPLGRDRQTLYLQSIGTA